MIHLGHNRTGLDIVETAIEEDAHAIAVTSYQGGHMEFYRYVRDLLVERDAGHIRLFGGGGGTILPTEGEELADYGVTRIYSPDDGRELGLQGMVADMIARSDFATGELGDDFDLSTLTTGNTKVVAGLISAAENYPRNTPTFSSRSSRRRRPPAGWWSGSPAPGGRGSRVWSTSWCDGCCSTSRISVWR